MPADYNLPKPVPLRGQWDTKWYGVASGETFKRGDHVMLNSSGLLVIAAAADANVGAVKVLGIANGNAADILLNPVAARRECPVLVPLVDGGYFLTQIYHGTFASATIAATDMDAPPSYEMRNAGADGWLADKSVATNAVLTLVERHEAYPFGETGGWFWAKYTQADHLHGA